ncbi:MAG TPA: LysR family transcriptional regulator [Burkholderiaceae bacterium]|nr:LysR family transcriptional regulator [Burkholderiaceae bacterium]
MSSIRMMKSFLAVARHGSFAAAGDEIGLSAAAVGLQMRGLEESLKQQLFDRSGRSVVLNTAGRQAVPRIEELVLRYEELVGGRDDDSLSGTVIMGALVSTLMGAFADALSTLKRQHPRLEVKLFAGQSSDFAGRVERGLLDAAIVTRPPRALPRSLTWTQLYVEPMVMIVPRRPRFELPKDPLQALREAPFIRFDRETWTGLLVRDVLNRCRVEVRDEMELNSVEAILAIVRQGFGVSIVPKLANVRWAEDRESRVIALPAIDVRRRVGLLERSQHTRMRFTGAIKRYFADAGPRTAPRKRAARPASGSHP